MSTRPHILYLTFDGLLSPLGYSQVARVVMRLAAQRDHRFTICSLEREEDERDRGRFQDVADELRRHHVRWCRRRWSKGGTVVDVARNLRAMYAMVDEQIEEWGVDLIHARSYVAASVARTQKRRHRIPYLFDTRGFWVDERIERGRWFTGPLRRRAARLWEKGLYEDAAGVVMLTEMARQEIEHTTSSPWTTQRPTAVIPTCVDYGEFGLGGPGNAGGISESLASTLDASLVVGYVGSINRAYQIGASLRLFDHLLARRPDAHLLCLTRNPSALLTHLRRHSLPESSYTVATVPHDEMPAWCQYIDWGLLLRSENDDQRAYIAAMPTKLAEFFATGVRPIYWGKNQEVRHWIEHAESGLVLDRCDEQALRTAADTIAQTPRCVHTLWGARWRTRKHFGLSRGVERYRHIYDQILEAEATPRRMKVLFLTEGTTVPASRFRVRQLVPHLERRGIDCTVRPAYGDGYNRVSDTAMGPVYKLACRLQRFPYVADAHRFDAVVLQRPALPFSALAERMANWRNPCTVFDVDDAIFTDATGEVNPRKLRAFEAIVRRCSHVICGNEYLARHTRHLAPTSVLPTVVDTDIYRPSGPMGDDEDHQVVLGWMGTPSNFDSLEMVVPALKTLLEEYDFLRVRIVSSRDFEPLRGVDGVDQKRWSVDDEVRWLQSFDIGIMPLVDNEITRGKCGFKAIQYMAVGIPTVASSVGVNSRILEGQTCGMLVDDVDEFEAACRRLIVDEEVRQRLGQQARKRAVKRYSVQAVIDRYVQLLEAVARQRPRIDVGDHAHRGADEARRSSA